MKIHSVHICRSTQLGSCENKSIWTKLAVVANIIESPSLFACLKLCFSQSSYLRRADKLKMKQVIKYWVGSQVSFKESDQDKVLILCKLNLSNHFIQGLSVRFLRARLAQGEMNITFLPLHILTDFYYMRWVRVKKKSLK